MDFGLDSERVSKRMVCQLVPLLTQENGVFICGSVLVDILTSQVLNDYFKLEVQPPAMQIKIEIEWHRSMLP